MLSSNNMISKRPNTVYSHERIAKALAKVDKLLGKESKLSSINLTMTDFVGPREIRFENITPDEADENPSKLYDILNKKL